MIKIPNQMPYLRIRLSRILLFRLHLLHRTAGNYYTPQVFLLGKLLLLIIAILILIFAGGGAYLALNSKTKPVPMFPQAVRHLPQLNPDPTASWKTYTNADLGFSIKHPDSINVDEAEGLWFYFKVKRKASCGVTD